ncbi:uncharacterized protein LOC127726347 [Mytilus californianus]|uniref:uncharacterized protein LOC127726347 n=1 Tax=Mytilus californianus TaxID=6549 RepID=UPI002245C8DE|nr:uncharacterized protein LOC127726347 [Mytilus californianus]XP_052089670.1 uncharacterized protein LOC127726347 [Mytilus californianus]XP_052089671.1 uncharacterized protein LOC127726347 [Mytilus californianus]
MNSHVFLKLGVAYKANLKHILPIIIFSVVFSGIFTMSNSAPINSGPFNLPNDFSFHSSRNMSDVLVPGDKDTKEQTYLFLHANNNMWLEILENGIVKANTCPTIYGALESGSHSVKLTSNGNMKDVKEVADNAAVYLRGVEAGKYLCVRRTGEVYASKEYDETDCAFVQKPQFETNGGKYHYFKHLYYSSTYKRVRKGRMRNHKTVRFQLGFMENGTVFVVQRHTQRRDKHKPMLSINRAIKEMPTNTSCATQINPPKKPKLRFKFCRKVWRNYFRSSIKDIRRFRKYNCWDKLRKMRKPNPEITSDTG